MNTTLGQRIKRIVNENALGTDSLKKNNPHAVFQKGLKFAVLSSNTIAWGKSKGSGGISCFDEQDLLEANIGNW